MMHIGYDRIAPRLVLKSTRTGCLSTVFYVRKETAMSIILESIFPVFALMILGHILMRTDFLSADFFKISDKLVYFILFPAMLFWKIGGAGSAVQFNWPLMASVLTVVFAGYLASLVYIKTAGVTSFEAGSFSQCAYRFNTYVGLAVILSALGEEGVTRFGVIISLCIPIINVLAVTTLIWFSQARYSAGEKSWLVLKALLLNPLIIGCLAGLAYPFLETPIPPFIDNTLRLLTVSALPLALLSIGAGLTFARFVVYFKQTLAISGIKLILMPGLGFLLLNAIGIQGIDLRVAMIFLALPTSSMSYILSSQLHSDPHLASAAVALTHVLSFVSLSIVLLV